MLLAVCHSKEFYFGRRRIKKMVHRAKGFVLIIKELAYLKKSPIQGRQIGIILVERIVLKSASF